VINVGKLVVKVLEGKEEREKQYEVMREELDPYSTCSSYSLR